MPAPIQDGDGEFPVADAFRPVLVAIVEALRVGDYDLQQGIATVDAIDSSTAQQIESYILDYGETLASLPSSSWDTSVSRWMEGYWELLVDLYTVESGESDLVLSARVFEHGDRKYRIEVMGVYVP